MSSTLKRWAIRRKSDGFYIEVPIGRNGRGGSHAECIDPSVPYANIRLFHTEKGAKIALGAWLQGIWVADRGAYNSGPPDWIDEIEESVTIRPVEGRNKDDMEIVEVEIVLPVWPTKPVWHLTGAVFIGSCLWGDPVEKEHPHYHEPGSDKHARTSAVLYRLDDNTFETKNSIYIVDSWVPNGRATIPIELDRPPNLWRP